MDISEEMLVLARRFNRGGQAGSMQLGLQGGVRRPRPTQFGFGNRERGRCSTTWFRLWRRRQIDLKVLHHEREQAIIIPMARLNGAPGRIEVDRRISWWNQEPRGLDGQLGLQ